MTRTLIMAVPFVTARAKRAIELHTDAEVQAEIVWDEKQDAIETWMRMLRQAGNDPVICLEDDVRLADNWRAQVEEVISQHGDEVIQFFSLRAADAQLGSRHMAASSYLMNQCHYLPAGAAADLLTFAQDWEERRAGGEELPTGQDTCLKRWMVSTRQRYWLQVPSLVQHEPWESEMGLITTGRNRSSGRQSPTFEENT